MEEPGIPAGEARGSVEVILLVGRACHVTFKFPSGLSPIRKISRNGLLRSAWRYGDRAQSFCGRLAAHPKFGSNLGPFAAELGTKPCTTTQNKAKRTSQIDYFPRLCKQGVTGSIPVTSTNLLKVNHLGRCHGAAPVIFGIGEQ